MSINLRTLLDREEEKGSSYLTGRALESLTALLIVLGISLVGLDPSISRPVFAAVLFASAAGTAISPVRAALAYRSTHVERYAFAFRLFLAFLLAAVYTAAGATLIARAGGGLQWLPAAFVLAISIAATNAWVLLVEVLR